MTPMHNTQPQRISDPQGKIGQILVAARTLFLTNGYGNTSMDAVAKHAGVSKSTVYAHFANKEQLFGAVVSTVRQRLHDALIGLSTTDQRDVSKMLRQIGTQFLHYVTEPTSVTIFRVVIGEIHNFPELGREMYKSGHLVVIRTVADFLQRWTDIGLLKVDDPMLAARQFLTLVKSDLQFRCLLDSDKVASESDIKRNVESATAMFLAYYGPKD